MSKGDVSKYIGKDDAGDLCLTGTAISMITGFDLNRVSAAAAKIVEADVKETENRSNRVYSEYNAFEFMVVRYLRAFKISFDVCADILNVITDTCRSLKGVITDTRVPSTLFVTPAGHLALLDVDLKPKSCWKLFPGGYSRVRQAAVINQVLETPMYLSLDLAEVYLEVSSRIKELNEQGTIDSPLKYYWESDKSNGDKNGREEEEGK